jgi:chemotaxis protein CheX
VNVKFINPFINALLNVLDMMGHTKLKPEKPYVKNDKEACGDISGLIGMVGPQARGSLSITFDGALALKVMERMVGEKVADIDDDVCDMVGEITNMVTGGAKKELASKNYQFDMATPEVVSGKNHIINHKYEGKVIVIPFNSDSGKAYIEICFGKVD